MRILDEKKGIKSLEYDSVNGKFIVFAWKNYDHKWFSSYLEARKFYDTIKIS